MPSLEDLDLDGGSVLSLRVTGEEPNGLVTVIEGVVGPSGDYLESLQPGAAPDLARFGELPGAESRRTVGPPLKPGWRLDSGVRAEAVVRAYRPLIIVAAAVVPFAACAVLAAFRDSVANTSAALGLVLLVVGAASTGVRWAGIVAALSSAAWFDFFLTEPYNQFTIADRADIETVALLCSSASRCPR